MTEMMELADKGLQTQLLELCLSNENRYIIKRNEWYKELNITSRNEKYT